MNTPPHPTSSPVVDVAVGVITRADGQVLLARRPAGKPAAGYWEFPGGKLEPGENPVEALRRELSEELGLELEQAYPWITRRHTYAHLSVRLHLYRVLRWSGEPRGREGQRLSWEDPRAPAVTPLLQANHSIIRALALPPIYAITHASAYGITAFMARLRGALEKGLRLVQVRERDMPAAALTEFAIQVCALAHPYGASVLINGDVNANIGADGVHLTSAQLMRARSRPAAGLCAASCHTRDELLQAAALGVDFVVLSPVLPTRSHPGQPALGWERFAQLCADLPMPVYALGGMRTDLLNTAMQHNAHGVALLSGIW